MQYGILIAEARIVLATCKALLWVPYYDRQMGVVLCVLYNLKREAITNGARAQPSQTHAGCI
jgi:hypothetical protein